MDFQNKTTILYNFNNLLELLNNKEIINKRDIFECNNIYGSRIAIKHCNSLNIHSIRIWRTKCLLDIWYNDFNKYGREFIGALDYIIYDNYIKINYIGFVNKEKQYMYNNVLEESDVEDLVNAFSYYLKILGIKEKKEKIILDVHENLKYFNEYFYYNGFNITNRKCNDNPYWLEAELIL